jgi:hypothetical protein
MKKPKLKFKTGETVRVNFYNARGYNGYWGLLSSFPHTMEAQEEGAQPIRITKGVVQEDLKDSPRWKWVKVLFEGQSTYTLVHWEDLIHYIPKKG